MGSSAMLQLKFQIRHTAYFFSFFAAIPAKSNTNAEVNAHTAVIPLSRKGGNPR
jgi:hypothetical protein